MFLAVPIGAGAIYVVVLRPYLQVVAIRRKTEQAQNRAHEARAHREELQLEQLRLKIARATKPAPTPRPEVVAPSDVLTPEVNINNREEINLSPTSSVESGDMHSYMQMEQTMASEQDSMH